MKIKNTSFNVEAVKAMTLEEFKKLHQGVVKGDLDAIYSQITGKKPKSKAKQESDK